MNIQVISNAQTINTFRFEQEFQIFNNFQNIKSNRTIGIKDLHKHIIQTNVKDKNKRKFIIINPTKNNLKTKESALLPHSIMLDIDLKTDKAKQLFIKDMGCTTIKEAMKEAIKRLRNDSCVFYCDLSSSNKGIKAFISILSDYYLKNYIDYQPTKENLTASFIMRENFKVMCNHIEKMGFKFYNNDKIDYIDNCGNRLVQGCYTSNGNCFYVNPNASILYYDLNINELTDKQNIKFENITKSEAQQLNNEYCEGFFNRLTKLLSDPNTPDSMGTKIINELGLIFTHYNATALHSIKHTDIKYQKQFYKILLKVYEGQSIPLNDFETFHNFISNINMDYVVLLKTILKNVNSIALEDLNHDFFFNKYDTILNFEKWISERKDELFKIFDDNTKVVLKAEAGYGKTTLLVEYIIKSFEKLQRIALIIPKNSLLEQQLFIIQNKYPTIKIIKNYGKGNKYNASTFNPTDKVLILSSTPKINNLTDIQLFIIDEIQNLVKYSTEIKSITINNIKTILVSATPEMFLIGESNFFYVNMLCTNYKKKILNVIVSRNQSKTLTELIKPNRKQLIFYNNIEDSKNLINNISGITFYYVNALVKDNPDIKELLTIQLLKYKHYICTSYLSDGINFNNIDWDDLIIIENGTLGPEEIYQLCNRFRKCDTVNNYLIAIPRTKVLNDKLNYDVLKDVSNLNDKTIFYKSIEDKLNVNVYKNEQTALTENKHFIKIYNQYYFNPDSVKLDLYNNVFFNNYKIYQDVFENSLNYYFNNYKCFKLQEGFKFTKNEYLEKFFKKYFEKIVELLTILDTFNYIKNIDNLKGIEKEVIEMVNDNKDYFKRIVNRVNELKNLRDDVIIISDDEIKEKSCLASNQYHKYIKNIKKRKLGNIKDFNKVDNLDELTLKRHFLLYHIIVNSNLVSNYIGRKETIEYFYLSELVEYFINNKDKYDLFINENNEHEFLLNVDSLGKFINPINKFFGRTKIKSLGWVIKLLSQKSQNGKTV
jgi:hypothetical protein